MGRQRERLHQYRAVLMVVLLAIGLGLLLTQCPANRDGMPGQLATAMQETAAAARSGGLALDLWLAHRSTTQLTSVQLSDARDEVVRACKGTAELKADGPMDVRRQRMLTAAMTAIIDRLNAASARLRGVTSDERLREEQRAGDERLREDQKAGEPPLESMRDDLRAAADALETGYR